MRLAGLLETKHLLRNAARGPRFGPQSRRHSRRAGAEQQRPLLAGGSRCYSTQLRQAGAAAAQAAGCGGHGGCRQGGCGGAKGRAGRQGGSCLLWSGHKGVPEELLKGQPLHRVAAQQAVDEVPGCGVGRQWEGGSGAAWLGLANKVGSRAGGSHTATPAVSPMHSSGTGQPPLWAPPALWRQLRRNGLGQPRLTALNVAQQLELVGASEGRPAHHLWQGGPQGKGVRTQPHCRGVHPAGEKRQRQRESCTIASTRSCQQCLNPRDLSSSCRMAPMDRGSTPAASPQTSSSQQQATETKPKQPLTSSYRMAPMDHRSALASYLQARSSKRLKQP